MTGRARNKPRQFAVIDLFAGPGGLGEGFARLCDPSHRNLFDIRLSIECEPSAHKTLELRAFFRQFSGGDVPDEYYKHLRGEISREDLFKRWPRASEAARSEAWLERLGRRGSKDEVDSRIRAALNGSKDWILIGGPPCQAYSLIGRSRNRGVDGYVAEDDRRHFLYREYLRIIAKHWPVAFVLENVRGLLTSNVAGRQIFGQMLSDLTNPAKAVGAKPKFAGYTIHPLEVTNTAAFDDDDPERFIVRAENHQVPQNRHRVILVGVRSDISVNAPRLKLAKSQVSVRNTIGDLPRLRSGLSGNDSPENWLETVAGALRVIDAREATVANKAAIRGMKSACSDLHLPRHDRGALFIASDSAGASNPIIRRWTADARIGGVLNHETRAHMESDIHRYLFVSAFGKVHGHSPTLRDFPKTLLPNHVSVKASLDHGFGYFADRFRVQVGGVPATTITSHIAKDGHYYIHYDTSQCRSLTVREAARIQTFPDNYFFCGNRTEQYTQVGNAVPPLLAHQIARALHTALEKGR